jgi:hypothetical protein
MNIGAVSHMHMFDAVRRRDWPRAWLRHRAIRVPDLAVSLTNIPLSERQCAELVALVGEDVLNVLSGNRK